MIKEMKHILVILLLNLPLAISATYYISEKDTIHGKYDIRSDNINELIEHRLLNHDSIFFKRGERFFCHIVYKKLGLNDVTFSSYGEASLPRPVIDGSIYHFKFFKDKWPDIENIKGVKFYKKYMKDLEDVENVYADDQILILSREPDADETLITGMKNSYTGFFKIDSVDSKYPKKVFYDHADHFNWGEGAEIITRTVKWAYEVLKFKRMDDKFTLETSSTSPLQKNWGYYVQRSYKALDSENEWFYDEKNGIIYFSTDKDSCTVYVSSNRENENSGIYIKGRTGVSVEDISFRNAKYGIRLEKNKSLSIKNCSFRNSVYGIINKSTYLDNIRITGNNIKNMRSFGVRIIGHNVSIENNIIDSIGLSYGCESRGFNNLTGIEVHGNNSFIANNTIRNTGYSGIRFFNAAGSKVLKNHVENVMQLLSDGGGIYSYHSIEGNKLIKGNIVINAFGNANGTDGKVFSSNGIYLDELSVHFKIDSNTVQNCGGGIYIQNSRCDTVINNIFKDNNTSEIFINHTVGMLNGGEMNPSNDPGFTPDTLSFIPQDHEFDRKNRIIYKVKRKKKTPVYVEPGNNFIDSNTVIPDENKYTFRFGTWQNIDNNIFIDLTGNTDFFRNNIPQKFLFDTKVQITGANVKNMNDKPEFRGILNSLDHKEFGFIKKIFIYIGSIPKNKF